MLKSAREVDARIKTGIPGRWAVGHGAYLQVAKTGERATASGCSATRATAQPCGSASARSDSSASPKRATRRPRRASCASTASTRSTDKRARREAQRAEERARLTFRDATRQFLAVHEAGWRNAKHRAQWRSTLEAYAFPKLGGRPVAGIDQALINETLAPVWVKTPETASRVKQRIERVLTWVKDGMPLPAPSAAKRVKHHAALAWQELPAFMARLRGLDSISARALEFTHPDRRQDRRDDRRAPGTKSTSTPSCGRSRRQRMKGHREHRVPLCDRALEILAGLPREEGNPHVFIGRSAGSGLSNMAMLSA